MMTTKLIWTLYLAASALMQQTAPPAQAPTPNNDQLPATIDSLNERETRLFERFDRNGDGVISLEEYRNQIVRYFNWLDKRHRGFLDESSLRNVDPEDLKNKPNDTTDRISLEDFQNLALIDFQKADANHDGQLTPEEFKTWLAEASVRRRQDK